MASIASRQTGARLISNERFDQAMCRLNENRWVVFEPANGRMKLTALGMTQFWERSQEVMKLGMLVAPLVVWLCDTNEEPKDNPQLLARAKKTTKTWYDADRGEEEQAYDRQFWNQKQIRNTIAHAARLLEKLGIISH